MDKRIVDELVKVGLITNINVDANDYKSVDELFNEGLITVPDSRAAVDELIRTLELGTAPVVDDTNVNETVQSIVDEVPVTEVTVTETPIVETPPTEDATVVETNETEVVETTETKKTTKKTTKKSE